MVKLYFSGWQGGTEEREVSLLDAGVTHRCFSYVNVCRAPGIAAYYLPGIAGGYAAAVRRAGIMMDSGVYSLRRYIRQRGIDDFDRELFIRHYAEFCRENAVSWDFYVTTDFEPGAEDVYRDHLTLEKLGTHPMPVLHAAADVSYLARYRDRGYMAVGVGCGRHVQHKRRHLDAVFSFGARYGMSFHGLALTSAWPVAEYPFASVDSSAWARYAANGVVVRYNPSRRRMLTLHVTDRSQSSVMSMTRPTVQRMPPDMLTRLRAEFDADGVTLDCLATDYTARHVYNALQFMRMIGEGAAMRKSRWRELV